MIFDQSFISYHFSRKSKFIKKNIVFFSSTSIVELTFRTTDRDWKNYCVFRWESKKLLFFEREIEIDKTDLHLIFYFILWDSKNKLTLCDSDHFLLTYQYVFRENQLFVNALNNGHDEESVLHFYSVFVKNLSFNSFDFV